MTRRPPRSTLCPYTSLFRSGRFPLCRTAQHVGRADRPKVPRPRSPYGAGLQWQRGRVFRSEEHTSELQSRENLVCRLLLEKKKTKHETHDNTLQNVTSKPRH